MRIECYRAFNATRLRREWRWRCVHNNGNIMATSGEGYARRIDLSNALDTLAEHFSSAVILWPEDQFSL